MKTCTDLLTLGFDIQSQMKLGFAIHQLLTRVLKREGRMNVAMLRRKKYIGDELVGTFPVLVALTRFQVHMIA